MIACFSIARTGPFTQGKATQFSKSSLGGLTRAEKLTRQVLREWPQILGQELALPTSYKESKQGPDGLSLSMHLKNQLQSWLRPTLLICEVFGFCGYKSFGSWGVLVVLTIAAVE